MSVRRLSESAELVIGFGVAWSESTVILFLAPIREGRCRCGLTENRARYNRDRLRYPSDLTDEEWALIEPLIPPAKPGGGKRRANMREVVNGLMYVLSTGCQWRAIPKDLPPRSTVYDYFDLWTCDGTLDRIHHALYVELPRTGRTRGRPTAAIIDSQSVKSAEKGGARSIRMATMRARRSRARSGIFSSIRKVCCCMPSFIPPTFRTAMAACSCWRRCSACFPFCRSSLPMAAIRGRIFRTGCQEALPRSNTEIVKRSDQAKGSSSCPGAGSSNAPSLGSTDVAAWPRTGNHQYHALAFLKLASIRLMLRKLCNH